MTLQQPIEGAPSIETDQEHLNPYSDAMEHLGSEQHHESGHRPRRKFILCFDGTGNKFSGTDSDSNILKIYRMLDRNGDDQFHYYQPGIGTYVVARPGKFGSHTSRLERFKSWYAKAKDSAVGTSFDAHVMGGYKFLMRYYSPGDDIFFFGFSRGAYTARFLAEMLDHVGLLSAGNEEMCHFAWKTFQKWQCRQERTPDEKQQKKYLLEFMCAFRETFSRPVRPIRFLGLFDTVNSVPHFESAWMQRSKFPYTARSSAKVIRHAVAIDERRAKFRQDLISQEKPHKEGRYQRRRHGIFMNFLDGATHHNEPEGDDGRGRKLSAAEERRDTLAVPHRFRNHSETDGVRNLSPGYSCSEGPTSDATSISNLSFDAIHQHHHDTDEEDDGEQDIKEVWFAGCHADIGGGWCLNEGEDVALSHVPLVWMVREAQRAGLQFDEVKLRALNCSHEEPTLPPSLGLPLPTIAIDPASPAVDRDGAESPFGHRPFMDSNGISTEVAPGNHHHHRLHLRSRFHKHLHSAATCGKIHDVLQFNNGVGHSSVISWNIMEYLPFRRMDLQEDGSWQSITWPLPKGEVRDIPYDALIHTSVIKRMVADEDYRPGNLIVGGGGRGVRRAPTALGMGKWVVHSEENDPVGECFIRQDLPERKRTDDSGKSTAKASSRR